jgi:hypothetical protein
VKHGHFELETSILLENEVQAGPLEKPNENQALQFGQLPSATFSRCCFPLPANAEVVSLAGTVKSSGAPNFSGLAAVVDASNHERLTSAKQMRQRLFGLRLNF